MAASQNQPPARLNWLEASTEQIEASQKQRREYDKAKAAQSVQALFDLERHLTRSIQSLHAAECSLRLGGGQCGAPFVAQMKGYIDGLSAMGALSTRLDEMTFPIALCDFLDRGMSPELQMRQNYAVTRNRNNLQRARVIHSHSTEMYLRDGLKQLREWRRKRDAQSAQNEQAQQRKESKGNDDEDEDVDIKMAKLSVSPTEKT